MAERAWTLRLPAWTVRLRLTALYGALFLVSGAVLLTITYGLLASRLHATGFYGTSNGMQTTIFADGGGVDPGPGDQALAVPAPVNPQVLLEQLRTAAAHQRANALHQLLVDSGVALAIMAIASMGLGWLVAGRALRPVRAMTAAAREISEHNLSSRLPSDGPADEIGDLATTFNALLGRLEAAFDSQRQFVANASHELRTPLTLERAVVEVALADPDADASTLRAACERVLAIGCSQEALIEALLTLARSQRGLDRVEPVDLAIVAAEVLDGAATGDVPVEPALSPAPVVGDPRLLERLVSNLVDNATRHNRIGGWVRVSTETTAGRAALHVTNSGPVIPGDQVAGLLQPFRRLSSERAATADGGLGLGLSIVAAIAAAHHAQLEVAARSEGGLQVSVWFRAAPAPR